MNNFALVVVVLLILTGAGWYVYSTLPQAEKPVMMEPVSPESPNDSTDVDEIPNTDDSSPEVPRIVQSFEDCVAAGNPVMESYPRQCRHEGEHFVEVLEETATSEESVACTMDAKICPDGTAVGRVAPDCEFAACPGDASPNDAYTACSPESREADFCTQEYAPVCGLTRVECITEPCEPVPQTYSNTCTACSNERVEGYTPGACET